MLSDPADALGSVIEFSIGLAGFSGIVAVFAHRNSGLDHADRLRLGVLLTNSLIPGFMAFFSLGALQHASPELAWRISSGLFAAASTAGLAVSLRRLRQMPDASRALISKRINLFISGGNAIHIGAQVVNTLGFFSSGFIVFYGGLVFVLLTATVAFVRLIFSPRGSVNSEA